MRVVGFRPEDGAERFARRAVDLAEEQGFLLAAGKSGASGGSTVLVPRNFSAAGGLGPPSRLGCGKLADGKPVDSPTEDGVVGKGVPPPGVPITTVGILGPSATAAGALDGAVGDSVPVAGVPVAGVVGLTAASAFAFSSAALAAATCAWISRAVGPQLASTSAVSALAVMKARISMAFARPCSLSLWLARP